MADRPSVPAGADIEVLGHVPQGQPRSRRSARSARTARNVIATADLAARAIGSEVGFIKTYLQGFLLPPAADRRGESCWRSAHASDWRTGSTGRSAAGRSRVPIEDDDGLPASERFFAGGDTSVRGFALDRLGNERTIPTTGFPTGGNSVVVLNSELRAHVVRRDSRASDSSMPATSFRCASDLSFIDLRPAAGFGLAYKSQRIGLARIDLGFNLDPQEFVPGAPERRWVLHFLLGQAFLRLRVSCTMQHAKCKRRHRKGGGCSLCILPFAF